MAWLATHYWWMGVVGVALLVVATILGSRFAWTDRWRWISGAVGAVLVVLGAFGLWKVFHSAPGGEPTVPEAEKDSTTPTTGRSSLERLRAEWSSHDRADWPVAETLAKLSEYAYLAPPDAKREFAKLGFSKTACLTDDSMLGYAVSIEDAMVVVFRGTNAAEFDDWIVNLRILPVTTDDGSLHKGFYEAYQRLKPQLDTILSESKPTHLWITGHSLGGALAIVCAYDLLTDSNGRWQIRGVVTFGQPLLAKPDFANRLGRRLAGRYVRFVNRSDPVPRIPPGYVPFGSLVWFTDEGIKRTYDQGTERKLSRDARSSTIPKTEIRPMTDDEFRRFKQHLKRDKVASENLKPSNVQDDVKSFGLLGDDIFHVREHSMTVYVKEVVRLIDGD